MRCSLCPRRLGEKKDRHKVREGSILLLCCFGCYVDKIEPLKKLSPEERKEKLCSLLSERSGRRRWFS